MAASETMDPSAKAVEEKIDQARESLGGRVKDKLGEVAEGAKVRAAALRDKIRETDFDDVVGNVTSYVKDNPGKSVAIALSVGFVLGLLLRRRGDD